MSPNLPGRRRHTGDAHRRSGGRLDAEGVGLNPVLAAERTRKLVRQMSGLRVVVVGDLMVDRTIRGAVSRISPEAPVPIVHLQSEDAVVGGAGNVARNLRALGARVDLVGVVGADSGAELFRRCLEEAGLGADRLVEVSGRTTTIKTRVVAHQQQVVRIDREETDALPATAEEGVSGQVESLLPGAVALLVSDYDKGVVTPGLLARILPAAVSAGVLTTVDPKPSNYDHYRPVTAITPNEQEARAMTRLRPKESLLEVGEAIRDRLGCGGVLLTQGEAGMTLFQPALRPLRIPARAREVFDVTGAGDTVIAVLTLALAAGASMEDAARLANLAAGAVVGKHGTATVSPDELLRDASDDWEGR